MIRRSNPQPGKLGAPRFERGQRGDLLGWRARAGAGRRRGEHDLTSPAQHLLAHAVGVQKFTTKGGTIECEEANAIGEATVLKFEALSPTKLEYKKCRAMGFVIKNLPPASVEVNANETFSIAKLIDIEVNLACSITIDSQGPLKVGKYLNVGGAVEATVEVTNLMSLGNGEICKYELEAKGIYVGKILFELVGGKVEWK
jgi:hypothetical protein